MKAIRGFRTVVALLLALTMILGYSLAGEYDISLGSVYVHATENDQTVKHGDQDEVSDLDPVITGTSSENTVTIKADANAEANVTFDDLIINTGAPAVKTEGAGDVNIELDGDSTVQSGMFCAGLQKENEGTLTIDDQNEDGGSLTATGGSSGAGIGGGYVADGSNITISGGKVTATGGENAAGIGGGNGAIGSNITITGGEVTATGGDLGAGIGGGNCNGGDVNRGAGKKITITGGEVTATGGTFSAGIGGGNSGLGDDITISGGKVIATGKDGGAGIGGGTKHVDSSTGEGTSITISGSAQVKVAGGNSIQVFDDYYGQGAAIGNGAAKNQDGAENVVIKNLTCGSIEYYDAGTSAKDIKDSAAKPIENKTVDNLDIGHEFKTEWTTNATHHWHACKYDGCVEKTDLAEHNWVEYGASAATCTANEVKAGIKCSVCGKVKQEPQEVPDSALGHDVVVDAAVEPTCTETGLTEGKHCSRCEWKIAQEVVPAKGHTPAAAVKENEKAPQVGVAGSYDEVVYCSDCKAELSRKTVTVDPQTEPEPAPQPEPEPEPQPEPEPAPQPEPEPAAVKGATKVILMFYADAEDAGTQMTAYVGQQITLPGAPAKDGATFLGWAESDAAPNDPAYKDPTGAPLSAGAQYKVTGPKCFVAVWQK